MYYLLMYYSFLILTRPLLAKDPVVRVRFPALPNFLRSSGSGAGPLSLVSTVELLERKSSGCGLEKR
jgi:hypothetical protein